MTDTQKKIEAYGIRWKNQEWLDCFHQLCDLYPKAFFKENPIPLSVGTRERLEARQAAGTDELLKGEHGQEILFKVLRHYCSSKAYFEAVVKGGNRINLEGETEGTINESQQAHARARLKTLYEPKVVVPPAPPKPKPKPVKKAKPPEKAKRKPRLTPSPTTVKVIKKKQRPNVSPRVRGVISHYVEDRGFGFLTLLEGGDAIFFHKSGLPGSFIDTHSLVGRKVTFQATPGRHGRGSLNAINIEFEEE